MAVVFVGNQERRTLPPPAGESVDFNAPEMASKRTTSVPAFSLTRFLPEPHVLAASPAFRQSHLQVKYQDLIHFQ